MESCLVVIHTFLPHLIYIQSANKTRNKIGNTKIEPNMNHKNNKSAHINEEHNTLNSYPRYPDYTLIRQGRVSST